MNKNVFFLLIIGLFLSTTCFVSPISAGSQIDLSNSNNFNVRFDGQSATNYLGTFYTQYVDLNNNGKPDIIVGAPYVSNNGSVSGSLYVIFDNHITSLTGTANTLDLANSSNWDIRYDGDASEQLSLGHATITDLNNDGLKDLIIPVPYDDNNGLNNSGSAYFILNDQITKYTGTGNTVRLSLATNYNLRLDGAQASTYFSYDNVLVTDLDRNNSQDLLINQNHANYNSRTKSGSVYYIKNEIFAPSLVGLGNTLGMLSSTNFNARFDGSISMGYLGYGSINAGDIDNNGKPDLILGQSDYVSGTTPGYTYLFDDNLLANISGTGNLIDLNISSNYSLRIAGSSLGDNFGARNKLIDINNDQLLDLIVSANGTDNNSLTTAGSAYIVKNSILRNYSGTGNQISVSDSNNFFLRIDGSIANGYMALGKYYSDATYAVDYDNDTKNDLFLSEGGTANTIYLVNNRKINSFSNSGNTLFIGDSDSYVIKYSHTSLDNLNLTDLNSDEQADFIFTGQSLSYNSRSGSGSIILVYNFPHVITINSSDQSGNNVLIKGNVSAPNSVTTVANVQYRVGDNNPAGEWLNCQSDDGQFNQNTELFNCSVPDFNQLVKSSIYIRAVDSNGVYTSQTNYKKINPHYANNQSTNTIIQIPFTQNPLANGRAVTAYMLDSTKSVDLPPVAQVPAKAFSFDAFLSAETVIHPSKTYLPNPLTEVQGGLLSSETVISGDNSLSFLLRDKRYWQVGPIYNIWYKAYNDKGGFTDAPKIIQTLQNKPSTLALYLNNEPTNSNQQTNPPFDPESRQIAFSADGKNWKVLSNSVSDTKNHSVAVITKIGGYYTIIAPVDYEKNNTTTPRPEKVEALPSTVPTKPSNPPSPNTLPTDISPHWYQKILLSYYSWWTNFLTKINP